MRPGIWAQTGPVFRRKKTQKTNFTGLRKGSLALHLGEGHWSWIRSLPCWVFPSFSPSPRHILTFPSAATPGQLDKRILPELFAKASNHFACLLYFLMAGISILVFVFFLYPPRHSRSPYVAPQIWGHFLNPKISPGKLLENLFSQVMLQSCLKSWRRFLAPQNGDQTWPHQPDFLD